MRITRIGIAAAALAIGMGIGLMLAGGLAPAVQADEQQAYAVLRSADGTEVGTATFVKTTAGDLRITVSARNLAAGDHGIHVHAVGLCEGTGFTTAGSHFNPAARKHGLQTSEGAHAGDLPNLSARSDGTASYETTVSRLILADGSTSLFDTDGSALVIHANRDDGNTDPTGNSGDRIVCGVVTRGAAPASSIVPPRTGDAGIKE